MLTVNDEKGLGTRNSHPSTRTRITGPRKRGENGPVGVLDGPSRGEKQRQDYESRNQSMCEVPTRGRFWGSEEALNPLL